MQALIAAFKEDPGFTELIDSIHHNNYPVHVWGLDKHVEPLVVKSVSADTGADLRLIITYDERRAREIVSDYKLYDRDVYYYPAKDALFYYADIHSNDTVKE
ncbi:MAG: hypothetical protein IJ053_06110, partial [Lachnospiraceae bacterium]|nr:hypothetical protein [Lachnospiraceae bacterium]